MGRWAVLMEGSGQGINHALASKLIQVGRCDPPMWTACWVEAWFTPSASKVGGRGTTQVLEWKATGGHPKSSDKAKMILGRLDAATVIGDIYKPRGASIKVRWEDI